MLDSRQLKAVLMRASYLDAAVASTAVPIERMSSALTEAPRPKSGILLEKGANGVPSHQRAFAIKNGRVSQVCTYSPPDVQVSSTIECMSTK